MSGIYTLGGFWACKLMFKIIRKSKMTQLNRMFLVDILVTVVGKLKLANTILLLKKETTLSWLAI